jgi:23S rRNA (guanine745-N1)-methyltransferase
LCSQGHNFDTAKEGYVNLLTGRQKSGVKGDTRAMLLARQRFFAAGHYEPLRRRLVELAGKAHPKVVAETGCGEGYYIGGVSEYLSGTTCVAYDISKEGTKLAARHYPKVTFAVADTNMGLPYLDRSVDVLLNVFAPRNSAEFARILTPGGRLIVVIPTSDHLAELRQIQPILAIQSDKREAVVQALVGEFVLDHEEKIDVPLHLNGEQIADLVGMTPNAWFLKDDQKQQLAAVETLEVTAHFEVLVFVLVTA